MALVESFLKLWNMSRTANNVAQRVEEVHGLSETINLRAIGCHNYANVWKVTREDRVM